MDHTATLYRERNEIHCIDFLWSLLIVVVAVTIIMKEILIENEMNECI